MSRKSSNDGVGLKNCGGDKETQRPLLHFLAHGHYSKGSLRSLELTAVYFSLLDSFLCYQLSRLFFAATENYRVSKVNTATISRHSIIKYS